MTAMSETETGGSGFVIPITAVVTATATHPDGVVVPEPETEEV